MLKKIFIDWPIRLLSNYAIRMRNNWFAPIYLLGIVFISVLWSFISFGRDEFNINTDGHENCYMKQGAEYQTLELVGKYRPEIKTKKTEKSWKILPLLEKGDDILVELPDGQRFWTNLKYLTNVDVEKLERLNYLYCHKFFGNIEKDFIGESIDNITDKYGEYSVHILENNVHQYHFPQIDVYKGFKKNSSGVVFETNSDGIVNKAYIWNDDDTRFCIFTLLPFYKTIVSWNLAYRKIADITFQHEKSGPTTIISILINSVLGILVIIIIASFPLLVLLPYACRFIHDTSFSNESVLTLFAIPYIIFGYIFLTSVSDSLNGGEFFIFCIIFITMLYNLKAFGEQIAYNRCPHCRKYKILKLIDSKVVDTRVDTATSKAEEVDEPYDNHERYVKITKRYNVLYRWYVDIVEKELYCTNCKNTTIITDELERKQTKEKELVETITEEIKLKRM